MDKAAFMQSLAGQLAGLPIEEIRQHQEYYQEILADMMEDGIPEQEAVEKLGDPVTVSREIRRDLGLPEKTAAAAPGKKTWRKPAIVLAVVGAPIWLSLALGVISVAGSLYLSIWAVLLSLAASAAGLAVGGFWAAGAGVAELFRVPACGLELLGGGLVMLALALILGVLTWLLGKAILRGTRWGYQNIKNRLHKRKETEL